MIWESGTYQKIQSQDFRELVLAQRRKKEAREFAELLWEQYLSRLQGLSYSESARRLNAEGVAARGGGKWYPQTVRNYYKDYCVS